LGGQSRQLRAAPALRFGFAYRLIPAHFALGTGFARPPHRYRLDVFLLTLFFTIYIMQKYDSYKSSGIEWIGEIPSHWEVKKIKYHIDYQKGKNPKELKYQKSEHSQIYLSMDYLRGNPKQILFVENPDEYIQIKENEVLLLWDGSNAGEFLLSKEGVLSSTMAVLYTNNILKEYAWYYFKFFEPNLKNTTIGMGIPHVNGDELKNSLLVLPKQNEQQAIADYLDRKTAEIDSLISDKKQLLALYEAEKTAIINNAVTKGIKAGVAMRDSGVEWLGEIPSHWGVKKLNYCFDLIGSGTTPQSDNQNFYRDGDINWLQTGDLNDGEIYNTSKKITSEAFKKHSTLKIYPENSIVIAMYGATIGKTGILKIATTTNQACCVLAKSKDVAYKFVFYWLNSIKKHIISLSYGGGQPNINQEQIRSLKIQIPPLSEQAEIVSYIEGEVSRIAAKVSNVNRLISLLEEYRSALISEVVTGKVRVV
jgi:type I restriction enzyme, S subunit